MNTWFALAITMVHTLWAGAAVALAALVSRFVLRRATARTRYAVALAWLVALALVPVVTWRVVTVSSAPLTTPAFHATPVTAAAPPATPLATATPRAIAPAPFAAEPDTSPAAAGPVELALSRWESLASVLPAVWLAGSILMLAWSLLGLAGAERLRRSAAPVDPHVRTLVDRLAGHLGVSRVDVLLCARVGVPVLVGILRPAILLPPAILSGLSAREVEMLLLHELAHVRRWDNLVNLLQRLVESVLFFHPAVWAVSAWVRHERENCCDDVAIAALDAPGAASRDYAGMLVRVHSLSTPGHAALLATAANGGDLVARVRRIITRQETMRLSRSSLAALFVCAAVSTAMLARSVLAAGETRVLTVEKGGQYPTIQSALDAAPDGATVRVGPGTWEEAVILRKPVTLEGAGWDKTTLVAAVPPEARQAAKDLAAQIDKGITIAEWKARVDALSQKFPSASVIQAAGTRGVTIKSLKVAGTPGANTEGSVNPTLALVTFDAAEGTIDNCVVAGSPGNGINVNNGSDLRVSHTLVAGVWSTGIQINPGRNTQTRAVIADSDVRNCYHRCIVIGRATDVTVERCRVWGTAWHCIRYDDASPTIRGNRFYNTARFGIYASGSTHATVSGNLFLTSEMEGMSCWFANNDTIEGNTFSANQRGGLTVLGASKPTVRRNLFVDNAVAISCSAINGEGSKAAGDPQLDNNWFWKNGADLTKPGDKEPLKVDLPPESNSHVAEIRFNDPSKADYSLRPGSPALAANAGVADPLPETSPFPTQPEEKQIMPDGNSWDYQKWKKG